MHSSQISFKILDGFYNLFNGYRIVQIMADFDLNSNVSFSNQNFDLPEANWKNF